ncbi:MAG: gephyrin-like molybdotransferase Glp [Candidatus Acidiferrales bacterium]
MLSYEEARAKIIETIRARQKAVSTELIWFASDPPRALGRIVAEEVVADRNYPPFDRAARDGYALRAADLAQPGAKLRCVGESRAGVAFVGSVDAGTCVQIMTGAAVPRGADAVVMQEYSRVEGDSVFFDRAASAGQNFVPAGSETRPGEVVVARGAQLGYAELAMAAQVGRTHLVVTRQPRMAILSTGDEVVGVGEKPGPFQIRNSNSISLASQVALAGGEPVMLGNAPDESAALRRQIERGLEADALVLSGGVSVGKYDLVEQVLCELGAEFFFDAIAIRPGRPAVFGWCRGKPVFGLPGNPVSTMVTFELLVVPAIDCLNGREPQPLPFFKTKLARPVEKKAALTHFLPARVSWKGEDATVEELSWEGSGDIGSVVRGNCFLVVHDTKLKLAAGEWVDVLPRRGIF